MEESPVSRGGARPRPPRPGPPTSISQRTSETDYEKLKRLHDESFLYIDQGLTCDEQGQGAQAVTLYKKGLRCIHKALSVNFQNGTNDVEKEEGSKKIKKMKTSQRQIQARVDSLQQDSSIVRALNDPPPSYEVTINPVGMSREEVELGNSIMGGISRSPSGSTADGWEVFSINDGVQTFFISPEGYVSAPSYPSSLKIISLKEDDKVTSDVESPPAFIQVGDWSYPLVPGCSPVLHANWGAYVFPDIESGQGAAVGIIIPDAVPEDARQKLEKTLQSLTAMKIQTPEEERARLPASQAVVTPVTPSASEESLKTEHGKIAGGIVKAAEWMSWGLQEGAKKTGELIHKGTVKLRENLKPQNEPSKIDPRLQQGAYYVKKATSVGVKVSSLIVTKLGEVTMALGKEMAPYVQKHGYKIVPQSLTRKSEDGGPSKMDAVLDVAKGGLEGWATLYIGLETAAGILAANVSKETVATVQHKYGKEAGTFADSTVGAVGNCAMTAMNVRHLGVKAIAKRVAKDTGKAVIHQSGGDNKDEGSDVDIRAEQSEEIQNENNVNLEGATAASYSRSTTSKRDYPPQKQ